MNRVIELVPFLFALAAGFLPGLIAGIWLVSSGRVTIKKVEQKIIVGDAQ